MTECLRRFIPQIKYILFNYLRGTAPPAMNWVWNMHCSELEKPTQTPLEHGLVLRTRAHSRVGRHQPIPLEKEIHGHENVNVPMDSI